LCKSGFFVEEKIRIVYVSVVREKALNKRKYGGSSGKGVMGSKGGMSYEGEGS